jgi:hypothetical protein
VTLFRQLVASALASRATFYSNPDLAPWSSNGGDRINKKIQQLLRKVGAEIPGAKEVVTEELAKIGRGGGGKGKTPTPTKKGGKKRKVEVRKRMRRSRKNKATMHVYIYVQS